MGFAKPFAWACLRTVAEGRAFVIRRKSACCAKGEWEGVGQIFADGEGQPTKCDCSNRGVTGENPLKKGSLTPGGGAGAGHGAGHRNAGGRSGRAAWRERRCRAL